MHAIHQLNLLEQVREFRRKKQLAMEEKQRLEGLILGPMEKIESWVAIVVGMANVELKMKLA